MVPRVGKRRPGRGVAILTRALLEQQQQPVEEARVAIQGFGNVGTFTARFLQEMGHERRRDVGRGRRHLQPRGASISRHCSITSASGQKVEAFTQGESITNDELLTLDVDVLVPAAIGGVLTQDNAERHPGEVHHRGRQ